MNDYKPECVFIKRLAKMSTAERARLKRCAGQALNETREIGLFYSILPKGVSQNKENIYFLVATLYAMGENTIENRDLGATLRQVRNEKNGKGLDRRIQILLDADENQLTFRLRQVMHVLQLHRARINWLKLIEDLLWWHSSKRIIQRRWARSYFTY